MIDTIVAPATPLGRGALAIVRIDGPRSGAILAALCGCQTEVRHATLVQLRHESAGHEHPEILDECVVIRYAAPHSFTGNDLVELTTHGSPVVARRVIEACVALGARMAQPGEFTERAVLNGKLDLVQAESIADLINSRTALQARLSLANLGGHLSRAAGAIRQSLLDVIARTEAGLDFAEEGYDFIGVAERDQILAGIERRLDAMAETFRRGKATTEGLLAAIVGLPNAGKSTLLNRLVGSERAIVTPIPGTTRDVVRETIEIGGLPVTFADTAGLRQSDDVVEGIGIARARDEARRAQLVLYLVDSSRGRSGEDERAIADLALSGGSAFLVIYTKTDLAAAPPGELAISASTGEGLEHLLRTLDALVQQHFVAEEGALVNERQRQAAANCLDAVRAARASEAAGAEEQLILVDLYRAANALGMLTGAITRDEVLTEIFGRFCIGK